MVWLAAQREDFVADVQAMRRRVVESLPANEAGRELKLGPGGLRDIEFAVQLLQLVHGRGDEPLRERGTLPALAALAAGGYVGRGDAVAMASAYRFLRGVEHLLQLRQLRRTHLLPEDPAVLREIGRALRRMRLAPREPGAPAGRGSRAAAPAAPAISGDPAAALAAEWRLHASQARQLHEKLFYRPLLDAVARLPGEVTRLTPEAARDRLEALGFADPAGALRHIEALTAGVSRKAAMQRTLLPLLLGWLADAPEPDAGLLAFRQVSEALGGSPWYLRLLRDNAVVAQRMARLLASSRYATGLLLRAPEAVAMLGDDSQLSARPAADLLAEAGSAVRRHDKADAAVGAVLAIRRRELLRTAAADVLHLAGIEDTAEALTAVAQVSIAATLAAAIAETERAIGPLPTRLAIIAMGRLGGHEMGYASDGDVLFVHDPLPGAPDEAATRAAHAVAESLRALLSKPGPDPALLIDAGLRPEGRQGPLVRTLASYQAYYQRWSVPWEAQALLRAEFAAGDRERRRRLPRDGRRHPVPAGRHRAGGDPRHQADQGPDGSRAHAARRRACAASQARARWPGRRRVGRPAAPAAARLGRAVAAHDADARGAGGGELGGPDPGGGRRDAERLLAARDQNQGRGHAGAGTAIRYAAHAAGGPGRGCPGPGLPAGRSTGSCAGLAPVGTAGESRDGTHFLRVTRRPRSRSSGRRVSSWKRTGESGWSSPRHRRHSAGRCRMRCGWRAGPRPRWCCAAGTGRADRSS